LFSLSLSLINLSLLIKLYLFNDYNTAFINLTSSLDSNLPDYINVDNIDKSDNEILNTSSLETNTNELKPNLEIKNNELTISLKEKLNNFP
jgi:hypothetical protein